MAISCASLSSCSKFKSVRSVTKQKVDRDPWGKSVNYSVGKDDSGKPRMESDLRSSFESVGGSNFTSGNNFSGKEYTKNTYRKKRWGGESEYKAKSYDGGENTKNYDKEPWFVQKQAGENTQDASEGKKSFFTRLFGASSAREHTKTNISKPDDVQTNVRRGVFKEPDVIDWKDQPTHSVSDTNRLLGR